MTWPAFLGRYCPIGRSRADEIIMIADGRKSLEEVREDQRQRWHRHQQQKNSPGANGEFPEDPEDTIEPSEPKAITGTSKKDARKATADALLPRNAHPRGHHRPITSPLRTRKT
ncbi:hypothetical protein [Acuticoccus kandeliae]|uniref:hypothetical protein n=1 Tax=Acuticoccus kandeliae TaxID=2073160 RepID=UPI0013003B5D|nr:hypothetical protein [Acuticoccus kandeliae]